VRPPFNFMKLRNNMKNKKERDKQLIAVMDSLRESSTAAITHATLIRDWDQMKTASLELYRLYTKIIEKVAENAKAIRDDDNSYKR